MTRVILSINLIFTMLSFSVYCEPTKLQNQMLNEPPTMMDIFIIRQELQFNKRDNSFIANYGRFQLPKLNERELTIYPQIFVSLNWEEGVFTITSNASLSRYTTPFELTLQNAKTLCLASLNNISMFQLDNSLAAHRGYSRPKYTAGDFKNFEEFNSGLKFEAYIRKHSYNKNIFKMYEVTCSTSVDDPGLDEVKFTFEGDWK